MGFIFKKLSLPDVILIEPKVHYDYRGYFFEEFKKSEYISNGVSDSFIQENISHSKRGVIRGMHYQKNPKAQSKLVSVINGEIFDVALDIRKNSPTFGKWVGEILSNNNHRSIFIPEGFAHGFCVISEEADVIYKVNKEYSPNDERGIIWNDPSINISWPTQSPIISKKDEELPLFKKSYEDFF